MVLYAKWLAFAGDWAYELALGLNTRFNWARRKLNLPYWPLSAYLKHRVKRAVNYIGDFETAIAEHTRCPNAEGVICGHIRRAAIRDLQGVPYINCGDRVESCTAIAETPAGGFEIIRWPDHQALIEPQSGVVTELGAAA